MKYPRILFYAVNGLGMGHVTRLLAIARQVRAQRPTAEILFLTSSEADNVIYKEGFAAFKVPSKTVRMDGRLRSGTYAQVVELATWNVLAGFRPHILVVDTFPAGAIQELLPILRWESRKVFVFRAQKAEKATDPFLQKTLEFYDLAIIPHCEGEEDIPLPEGLALIWAGPILIRSREEMLSPQDARNRLGLPEGVLTVYVSFGGGGDKEIDEALKLVTQTIEGRSDLHPVLALGQLYRGDMSQSGHAFGVSQSGHAFGVSQSGHAFGVSWIENYYPIAEVFPAFDLAISAAGYNTTMELLHVGVPTIFIPFDRAYDDQGARARRIAGAGAGFCLDRPRPAALSKLLDRLKDPAIRAQITENARSLVPENGAGRAAQGILELLE